MIPAGTNIDDLIAQLNVDRVAFSDPGLAQDKSLNEAIASHLEPNHALAVVDVFPVRMADTRDIAQELSDATGIPTVIVQTPVNVSAVSPEFSRANIEAAQSALPPNLNQIDLLESFYSNVHGFTNPWVAIIALIACFIAICAVLSFLNAQRNRFEG